jgi:hypothetical protein
MEKVKEMEAHVEGKRDRIIRDAVRWAFACLGVGLILIIGTGLYYLAAGEKPTTEALILWTVMFLAAHELERGLKKRNEDEDIIHVPIPIILLQKQGVTTVTLRLETDDAEEEEDEHPAPPLQ